MARAEEPQRGEAESGAAESGAAGARRPAPPREPLLAPAPRERGLAPLLLLTLGLLGISTSTLWARLSDSDPAELAFRRLILTVPVLWLLARARRLPSPPAEVARGAVIASGISLAIHFAAYYAALDRLSAAVTLVFVSMHPVILVALEAARGAARLDRVRLAGIALALAGTVWLARDELTRADGSVAGVCLGLASAVAFVGYLLAGRVAGRVLPAAEYARRSYSVAAVALALGVFIAGGDLIPENAAEWRIAGLLALFPTLLGHTPMNAALRSLPASVVSTAFLGEVVGASLLVWIFLREEPPAGFWAGGAAIAAGIVVVATAGSRGARARAG